MKIFLSALLIFCLLFLYSCGESGGGANDILAKMLESEVELPFGNVYLMSANEGDVEYLSERVKNVLYGKKEVKEVFPMIKDYAIYVSSVEVPYEIAVFCCYSRSDADAVVKMCLGRADSLKAYMSHTLEFEKISVRVMEKGRFVSMYVGSSAENAERAFVSSVKRAR